MGTVVTKQLETILEGDDDLAVWFQMLCEYGPDALTAVAYRWQEILKKAGFTVQKPAVEDSLLELAHELLPDSPAGKDPHSCLFNRVVRWIGARPFKTTDAEDAVLNDAFYATLPEFREALRVWAKAGLEKGRAMWKLGSQLPRKGEAA